MNVFRQKISTQGLMLSALFTAAIAVCSQLMIPLPMVPINLALLAVYLCGAVLPPLYSTLSVAAFLLLGMVGVPVFAGLKGGVGALFGMTGGYLLGYLLCVLIIGFLRNRLLPTLWGRVAMFSAGLAVCYALGTVWFMAVTGHSLSKSLALCVWPFLPGDAVKIALAAVLTPRLMQAVPKV